MGSAPVEQLPVAFGRFPAAVNGQNQCPQANPFFKVTAYGFLPVLLHCGRHFGVAVTRQVDQPSTFIQCEENDLLGPARSFTCPGEPAVPRDGIDGAGFSDVRPAGKSDFAALVFRPVTRQVCRQCVAGLPQKRRITRARFHKV